VNPVLPSDDSALQLALVDLRYSLHLNSAQAGLKQGTPAGARSAITQCGKALELDEGPSELEVTGELRKKLSGEEKAKAYYRRAMAYNAVKEPDSAYADLQKAAEHVRAVSAVLWWLTAHAAIGSSRCAHQEGAGSRQEGRRCPANESRRRLLQDVQIKYTAPHCIARSRLLDFSDLLQTLYPLASTALLSADGTSPWTSGMPASLLTCILTCVTSGSCSVESALVAEGGASGSGRPSSASRVMEMQVGGQGRTGSSYGIVAVINRSFQFVADGIVGISGLYDA
jgi:hypothetical protein